MLNQKKSGFHIVVVIPQFSSEGRLKGEGVVIDRVEHKRTN